MTPAAAHVLLVEDSPADARLLQEMVAATGAKDITLAPCRRLAEACDLLAKEPINCVLLDLSLPDAHGLEGIDRLRKLFPAVPIVILTGLDDEGVAMEALQAGAQDYLVKGSADGDGIRRAVRHAIERKASEEALAKLARRTELILDSAGEGICGLDPDGVITFANPAAASLLGCDREGLLGARLHDVVHPQQIDGHAAEDCPILTAFEHGTAQAGEVFLRADGTNFPVEYTAKPIETTGPSEGAVLTFRDITERKRAEVQLQYLADHDVLTGLFNRRRFAEELSRQIGLADRLDLPSALLLIDIDNFKFVNDALGHHAGDELIRSLAAQLKARVRRTDFVARLGGDEFALLMTGAGVEEAQTLAEELLAMVRRHRVLAGDGPAQVTTSIGIAMLDSGDISSEQILMEADVAMYEAKGGGRDRVTVYSRECEHRNEKRDGFVWTDRIKRALAEDRLLVYAQPIECLQGEPAERFELLVRMLGDDGEIIPPASFLPVAERFGLIGDIDAWMLRQAIRLIEEAEEIDRKLILEVNLSGHSICDPGLPDMIEEELTRSPIDPSRLVFEITETAAIANMDEARALAGRLRRWGCRFALDDFGAGFGSFYYLKYLPVDYLKVDGEFIRSLDASEIDQQMVKAMVEMARALGLQTVAEFVENESIMERLREYRVDFAQGYHVGKPKPIAELMPRFGEADPSLRA